MFVEDRRATNSVSSGDDVSSRKGGESQGRKWGIGIYDVSSGDGWVSSGDGRHIWNVGLKSRNEHNFSSRAQNEVLFEAVCS